MLEAKFALLFSGLVLFLISAMVPSSADTAQMLTAKLQELNNQRDLCKDFQCVASIDSSINYVNTALNVTKIPDQIKQTTFIFGILAEAGFAISLKN